MTSVVVGGGGVWGGGGVGRGSRVIAYDRCPRPVPRFATLLKSAAAAESLLHNVPVARAQRARTEYMKAAPGARSMVRRPKLLFEQGAEGNRPPQVTAAAGR